MDLSSIAAKPVSLDKPVNPTFQPTGMVVTVETEAEAEGSHLPELARSFLCDQGLNPAMFDLKSAWQDGATGEMRFSFRSRPGAGLSASLTDAELDRVVSAKKAEHVLEVPSWDVPRTALVLTGDFQISKEDGDGTAGMLARFERAIDKAYYQVEYMLLTESVEKVVIAFMGDHIEGFASQGGANAWRTPIPLSEQVRIARRMMLYTMEKFATIGVPLQMVAVPGNHGECLADDHQLLTPTGWVQVSEYAEGTPIATRNPDTGAFEWQVPTDWYMAPYAGDMIHIKTANTDMLVTPNHDMWTTKSSGRTSRLTEGGWRKIKAADLVGHKGSRLVQHGTTAWDGTWGMPEDGPDLSPADAARFLGWYVAEGWTDHRADHRVHMAQSPTVHPEYYEEICTLISKMGLTPDRQWNQVRFSKASLGKFLVREFGTDSGTKRLPAWLKDWPVEYLRIFMDGYLAGDGHAYSENGWAFKSKSERLLDDLQEVSIKLGNRMAIGARREYPVGNTGYVGVATEAALNKRHTSGHKGKHVTTVQYEGNVYCPTVPNGLIITRRNGKVAVTGNCVRFAGGGITRYDDSWDTEALVALADAAKMSERYKDVQFFVPQTDELSVGLDCSGTHVIFTHGHMAKSQDKLMDWVKGQAFNRDSTYAGADLVVTGHWHSYYVKTDGDRTVMTAPSMESESTWYRHRAGTSGDPGLIVALTGQGRTDQVNLIR